MYRMCLSYFFLQNWQCKGVKPLKLGVSTLRAKTPLRLDNFGKKCRVAFVQVNVIGLTQFDVTVFGCLVLSQLLLSGWQQTTSAQTDFLRQVGNRLDGLYCYVELILLHKGKIVILGEDCSFLYSCR